MLTEVHRTLWDTYRAAENGAIRAEKLRALDVFLDALSASPSASWFPWARDLAEQVVDHGLDLIVRQSLFDRALFPALLAGHQARIPGCARWLAGLSQQLYRCRGCSEQLPPEERSELGLLRAAIRHDPGDARSRGRLIAAIQGWLRHSLHELPAGVLYGMDGATPEQCRELRTALEEFCRLVNQDDSNEEYAELIQACRLHFRAYEDYLVNRGQYASYADYLNQVGISASCGRGSGSR